MTRNDVHRPSVINPGDYEYVGQELIKIEGLADCHFIIAERQRIRAHMERTGGTYSHHVHGGNCHVCGSVNAVYTVLFYHTQTNSYVRTGSECAEKLGYGDTEVFRHQVRSALEQVAGKRKAQALLELHGLGMAWEVYNAQVADDERREEPVIRDLVHSQIKYGSLTDPQLSLLRRMVDNVVNRATLDAQRAAEAEAAKPVPVTDKRMTVRGKIVHVKVMDHARGFCGPDKMLIQHADGWKLWGTLPSGLERPARGAEVEFNAKVKVSDKDPKFGYFSRPTKAVFVNV